MSTLKNGYYGISTYPDANMKSSSSIYCASDESMGEVFIIPLTIGCFSDMYKIISSLVLHGSRIRIIPLSLQYDYISDIYNIVTLFNREYNGIIDVKWVFPKRPTYYYSEEFELAQIKTDAYANEVASELQIEFIESGIEDLYDVIIRTPDATKYFTLSTDEEKLNKLLEDEMINEVHFCGSSSRHGGICAVELTFSNDKIRLFNISSRNALLFLRSKHSIGIERERWRVTP